MFCCVRYVYFVCLEGWGTCPDIETKNTSALKESIRVSASLVSKHNSPVKPCPQKNSTGKTQNLKILRSLAKGATTVKSQLIILFRPIVFHSQPQLNKNTLKKSKIRLVI